MASINSCNDIEPELSLSKIWKTRSVKKGCNKKRREKNETIELNERNSLWSAGSGIPKTPASQARQPQRIVIRGLFVLFFGYEWGGYEGRRQLTYILGDNNFLEFLTSNFAFVSHSITKELFQTSQGAFIESGACSSKEEKKAI